MSPGYTPYDKMLQYQVYDVTDMLDQSESVLGEHALGAILGDGWYRGKVYLNGSRNVYGTRLALLAQLRVELVDGRVLTIGTDSEWGVTP